MSEKQIALMIGGILFLLAVILFFRIRRSFRRFLNSAEIRFLREFLRSAQSAGEEQEEQPKSPGGMTRIYLPQILRDFPEWNWEEMQTEVEQAVKEFLEKENIQTAGAVRIHKTVINRYQRYGGSASIFCETAAEYWREAEPAGENGMKAQKLSRSRTKESHQTDRPAPHKKQTVCETELVYIYDSGKAGAAASVVCPNCGAPVEQLGVKQCRYCGSALEISGMRAWKVHQVTEKVR